jgi:hypothetical protein
MKAKRTEIEGKKKEKGKGKEKKSVQVCMCIKKQIQKEVINTFATIRFS